jgi:hypothetical protein
MMATRTDTQSPELNVADNHDLIRVQGARENNLKDVSVEIPTRRLTVFTGVSGSGKNSVFGTIAADSQRLINETYSAFPRSFFSTSTATAPFRTSAPLRRPTPPRLSTVALRELRLRGRRRATRLPVVLSERLPPSARDARFAWRAGPTV